MSDRIGARVWRAVKSRLSGRRPDHGTGYYVRSTAHPVVPGVPMTHDQAVEALNSLDAVYDVDGR